MQQAARVSDRTAFFTARPDETTGNRTGLLVEFDQTAQDLLQPRRQAHRGLHLRSLRLSCRWPAAIVPDPRDGDGSRDRLPQGQGLSPVAWALWMSADGSGCESGHARGWHAADAPGCGASTASCCTAAWSTRPASRARADGTAARARVATDQPRVLRPGVRRADAGQRVVRGRAACCRENGGVTGWGALAWRAAGGSAGLEATGRRSPARAGRCTATLDPAAAGVSCCNGELGLRGR